MCAELSYDHPEYYLTCARVRTFNEHMEPKIYGLEHTKPLFNEHKILSLCIIITHMKFHFP